MDCAALILDHRSSILDESYKVLERSHVHHYEAAGEEFTRARLEGLFDLVVTAIGNRDLAGVSAYAVERGRGALQGRLRHQRGSGRLQRARAGHVAPDRGVVARSGPRRGDRPDEHRARFR